MTPKSRIHKAPCPRLQHNVHLRTVKNPETRERVLKETDRTRQHAVKELEDLKEAPTVSVLVVGQLVGGDPVTERGKCVGRISNARYR